MASMRLLGAVDSDSAPATTGSNESATGPRPLF